VQPRRELMALLVAAVVIIGLLVAFFIVDVGWETTPVQRTEQQNSGGDAPSETLPSPGTVEGPEGDPALPPDQQ
jgi:hypothetical protein